MEVEGCGCFTHLQLNRLDLVTTLSELYRPIDSRRVSPTYTGRGSPPLFLEESMDKISSQLQRIGYITANVRSVIGNDGAKPIA